MIFLLIIPIFIFEFINGFFGGIIPLFGGWTPISQFFFFIYGFILVLDKEFKTTIEKHAIPSIIVVLVTAILLGLSQFFFPNDLLFLVLADL